MELGIDAPEVTFDDVCRWIEAQPLPHSAIAAEICTRIRDSSCSAAQLLLAMDQDELFDVLQMPPISNEDDRKHALALIREGRHALRKDYCIALKDLPDAMDKAVYVMEQFPLVVDVSGQATRFLKYQRGTTLMVESPRDMAPESLRSHLVGALKHDIRDNKGSTLLAIAAQYDHVELVRMLLTKWKVLAESAVQISAGSSTFAQQQLSKKQELLAKMIKPNVNARGCRGWTPVSIAVFHGVKRSLRVLLEHGADPKLKNQYNKNAYDFAKDILDAANNVVTSKAEIRQVLIDWESEQRRVVDVPLAAAEGVDAVRTAPAAPRKQKKDEAANDKSGTK
ncbi:Set3 histone deacetylase complex ankyrin repeat protein, partial [Globisporangium splendens]